MPFQPDSSVAQEYTECAARLPAYDIEVFFIGFAFSVSQWRVKSFSSNTVMAVARDSNPIPFAALIIYHIIFSFSRSSKYMSIGAAPQG